MKRLLLILLLPIAIVACTREAEELPLYQQYAARQDLTTAQVTGFHVNDTVKVDVVILVADDTTAWRGLKEEFDIRTDAGVTTWMGNIEQPQQRVRRSDLPAWRAMAVHDEKTIAFYLIDTEEQYEALLDYQMDKLTEQKTSM